MNTASVTTPVHPARAARIAGVTLIVSTLLGLLVLAHHPGITVREMAQAGEAARHLNVVTAWIHGVLMAFLVIWYCGLLEFAVQRGLRRASVRIGLVLYTLGMLAMLGAATISGFAGPRAALLIADMASAGSLPEPAVVRQLLVLTFVLNQALANIGAVASSLGIAAWSLSLLRGSRLEQLIGLLGVLTGILLVPLLISGYLVLDRHGIMVLEGAQALWTLGIGILLVRTRI